MCSLSTSLYNVFPPIPLFWSVLTRAQERHHRFLVVAPCWPAMPWFSLLLTLTTGPPQLLPVRKDLLSQIEGALCYNFPGRPEIVYLAPGVERMLSQCSAGVRNTFMSARTPSTRRTYASKWKQFVSCCTDRALSPTDCPNSVAWNFLQYLLDAGRSPATLMALFHCMVQHGTVRYGSLLGGFPLGTVPGTFLVPPQPRFQAIRTVTKT